MFALMIFIWQCLVCVPSKKKCTLCSCPSVVISAEQQFPHTISSKQCTICLKVSADAGIGICKAYRRKQDRAPSTWFCKVTDFALLPLHSNVCTNSVQQAFSWTSSVPSTRHFRSGFPEKPNSTLPKLSKLTKSVLFFFFPCCFPSLHQYASTDI